MINVVDYENGANTHVKKISGIPTKNLGYVTPCLGSARSNKKSEHKENYNEENSEDDDELMDTNDRLVKDALEFAFGSNSPKNHSRNKNLDYRIPSKIGHTQEEQMGDLFRKYKLEENRSQQKYLATQSDDQDNAILENYENYSFLKGNNGYLNSVGEIKSKISNGNLSSINNDNKNAWQVMDTSAIEVNQSHDFDEFDDVLNSLTKNFKQREGKKSKAAF